MPNLKTRIALLEAKIKNVKTGLANYIIEAWKYNNLSQKEKSRFTSKLPPPPKGSVMYEMEQKYKERMNMKK